MTLLYKGYFCVVQKRFNVFPSLNLVELIKEEMSK